MADYLTQADVSDFGEDLVSFAQRAAAHALAPTLQQIEANQAALGQALATEARRNLDRRVADLVPDYAALDRDPRWRSWLNQTESLSGRRRRIS